MIALAAVAPRLIIHAATKAMPNLSPLADTIATLAVLSVGFLLVAAAIRVVVKHQ